MKDNSKEKQPEDKKDFNKDKRIEEMKDNDKRNILHLAILTKDEKIIQKVIAFLGKPFLLLSRVVHIVGHIHSMTHSI